MKKYVILLLAALLLLAPAASLADEESKKEKKEGKKEEKVSDIDAIAEETLKELFEKSDNGKELYGKAAGYAVFAASEAKLMISGGTGKGVAVDKATGERTYMKMATAGAGLGLGFQRVRVVFLFETEDRLHNFVNKGWDADASATAAAGTAGANAKSSFVDNMAVFQFTKAGLIAQASVKGTKYWKADELNEADERMEKEKE